MTNEATQRLTAAQATPPAARAAGADLLTLDDVGVRLGGRQVLSDVTFSLGRGEFTGIIGPNGAGKTTLLRVILGLIEPSGGRVLIDGEPVRAKSKAAIGYVPQKLVIDPDMPLRARDVVALGIDGNRLGFAFPSRQRRDMIEAVLADVGAAAYASARMGELSGGELDEPLANLDIKSEQEIVAVLDRLAREQGIAVLLSAHDMNPLLGVMDRIVYVANGRVATGATDEVVTSENLTRLYGHQVDVVRVQNRVLVVAGEQ
jgi:zinc/manganese transport system ATP-binding protein